MEKFLDIKKVLLLLCVFFFILPAKYFDIPFYFAFLIFVVEIVRKKVEFPNEAKWYLGAWLVWALAMGVTSLFSPDRAIAFHKWPNHFLWVVMPFVVVVTSNANEKWLRRYLYAFITLGIILASIMVYQGMILRVDRAGTLFMTYNITICTNIVLIISVVAETIFLDKKIDFPMRKLLGFVWLMMILGVIYTRTRGAWIAGSVAWSGILVIYILHDRRKIKYIAVIVAVIGMLFVMNPYLLGRWNNVAVVRGSNLPRIHLWIAGWNMFKDHPIVGVGYECFDKNFHGKYIWDGITEDEKKLKSAHSQFIEALSEGGIIGLIGYMSFVTMLFGRSWKQYRKYSDPYSLMIFAINIIFFVSGFVGVISGSSHVLRYYWLLMGTLVLCSKEWKKHKLLEQNEKD